MITPTVRPRQPHRIAWSRERLLHERSIALGYAINDTTFKCYGSALNSYLNFVKIHKLATAPTPDTLSLYIAYMSHHINPKSLSSYLSGICNQLEIYFPDVRAARNSPLVKKTLSGSKKRFSSPTKRKTALTLDDILYVAKRYPTSPSYDDDLFLAMLTTGFFALLRLGEMAIPDDLKLRDYRKVTLASSVSVSDNSFSFFLPTHKADAFFEGNRVLIKRRKHQPDPYGYFIRYWSNRHQLFPLRRELWLMSNGQPPPRAFFINRLHALFDNSVAGQSLRAGGATFLAESGVAPHLIQATGRWATDSFQRYIRKHPIVLHALALSRHSDSNFD